MIKFVYGFLPTFISYSDDLPEGVGGQAKNIFIKILPKYKDDNGILEHEKTHVKQFYKTFMLHGILYRFSKSYRLKSEIEAYVVQLKTNEKDGKENYIDFYSKRITEMYNLDITIFDVKEMLLAKL
jgi:hypothetical protein